MGFHNIGPIEIKKKMIPNLLMTKAKWLQISIHKIKANEVTVDAGSNL